MWTSARILEFGRHGLGWQMRTRLSPEMLALRGTARPDREQAHWQRTVAKCTWRLRPKDMDGMSATARAFVVRADAQYLFNDKAGELVLACGDAIDRLAELRKAIRTEAEQIPGSRGRQKTNPKVLELRRLDRRLLQAVRHLGLTLDSGA
jgi:hypothetical protein